MGEPFVQCGWILGLWKRETLQQCTTVLHPSFAEQQALCFPPGVSISESIEICALYIVSNIACVHVCKYTHAAMYTVQINFFKQRWKKHPKIQASFPPKANASNASGSYAAQPLIPWGSHGLEKLLNVQCSQNAHEMLYYAILERNVIIEQKLSKESVFMLSHWVHYCMMYDLFYDFIMIPFMISLVLWLHSDYDFSMFFVLKLPISNNQKLLCSYFLWKMPVVQCHCLIVSLWLQFWFHFVFLILKSHSKTINWIVVRSKWDPLSKILCSTSLNCIL